MGWIASAAIKLIYGAMPKASYEEAIDCFKRAEECYSNAANLQEMGQVYLLMKKQSEAKEVFQKVLLSSDELPVYREAIAKANAELAKL